RLLPISDSLGTEVNTIGNFTNGEWDNIVRHRRPAAQFNVFFVREVETDPEGTTVPDPSDPTGRSTRLTDTADAITDVGGNGDCSFEDDAGRDVGVTLAHEAGHALTLDHDNPVPSTRDMLMFPTTDRRGRRLTRVQILQVRRNVRRTRP